MSKNFMERSYYEESLDDLWHSFQTYNKSKNLSKATERFYRQTAGEFIEWLKEEKGYDQCGLLRQIDIYEYKEYLRSKDIAIASVNSNIRGVRTLVNFGIREMYFSKKLSVELMSGQKTVKKAYDERELEALLQKPQINKTTFATYRTWVAVNFLLGTGARLRTVVNVRVEDLDFSNRLITLTITKNKKPQIIPMSAKLAKVLREFLSYRQGSPKDYLFCSSDGSKLTRSGFTSAMQRYHKRRGVERSSVHLYRHTFAKIAIQNGIDPLRLQKLLGHSTLKMTQEYVNLYGTDLQKGFNDYSPLDSLAR